MTFDSNMTELMLRRLDTGQVRSYANVRVINELQGTHTPATFFLAGKWVQRYPDLTRRIAADPAFALGSHSYAHLAFTAHCYQLGVLPTDQMAADVERSFQILAPFRGRQTRYFRFPGGCYDNRALRAIAPVGCTVVQYDIVSHDAFNNDAAAIIRHVLSNAHNGGIVVLHITEANAPRTADALGSIITGLRAHGYQLVTLSQLRGLPGSGAPSPWAGLTGREPAHGAGETAVPPAARRWPPAPAPPPDRCVAARPAPAHRWSGW